LLSRRFTIWQKATAIAPVLLLLVYLPAQALMRCRMDGLLRTACCCPHGQGQGDKSQDTSPALQAQDCCERAVTPASSRPTAEAARAANRDIDQMTAVVYATPSANALIPRLERPDGAWPRHGPPREGPPIVLLKHAFLI
jgi:hypothetical protein